MKCLQETTRTTSWPILSRREEQLWVTILVWAVSDRNLHSYQNYFNVNVQCSVQGCVGRCMGGVLAPHACGKEVRWTFEGGSALPRSMRMACCSEETCFSSSLYGVWLAGGWDETICLSKCCSDRNFQTSPRCCFGTPVKRSREDNEEGDIESCSNCRLLTFKCHISCTMQIRPAQIYANKQAVRWYRKYLYSTSVIRLSNSQQNLNIRLIAFFPMECEFLPTVVNMKKDS